MLLNYRRCFQLLLDIIYVGLEGRGEANRPRAYIIRMLYKDVY